MNQTPVLLSEEQGAIWKWCRAADGRVGIKQEEHRDYCEAECSSSLHFASCLGVGASELWPLRVLAPPPLDILKQRTFPGPWIDLQRDHFYFGSTKYLWANPKPNKSKGKLLFPLPWMLAPPLTASRVAAGPVKCAAANAAWETKRGNFSQPGHVSFQVCSSLALNSYEDKKQASVQHGS